MGLTCGAEDGACADGVEDGACADVVEDGTYMWGRGWDMCRWGRG